MMLARISLFILLISSISFSAYSGRMVAVVEKEWDIASNGTIQDVLLNSSFLAHSQYQRILSMNTTHGELVHEGDEIRLVYRAPSLNPPRRITATATIEISYLPPLASNPPLTNTSLPSTELTDYTEEMSGFARSKASSATGQLHAAAILTDWVHRSIKYDTAFWGSRSPASQVYSDREAVCVGYTHLLISLARSIGIESRYVSGYAFSEGWQEHAWAEFRIGGAWVPADPTFGEFALIDARHIPSKYSDDQSGHADRLSARGGPFSFGSTARVHITESTPFPQQAPAYAAFDGTEFTVVVTNPGQAHITPTYTITFPPYIHREDKGILFLAPGERKVLAYELDTSSLGRSSQYTIPYVFSMQGTEISDSITISRGGFQNGEGPPSAACPVSLVLFASLLLAFARMRSN